MGYGRRVASGFGAMGSTVELRKSNVTLLQAECGGEFFVDQANGKVYEVVGGSAALLCWRIRLGGLGVVGCDII